MLFDYVKIKNYKGIEQVNLNFDEDQKIYTLVGLNESGKTTILEAINFVFNPPTSAKLKEELIPRSKIGNFTDVISVELCYTFNQADLDKLRSAFKEVTKWPDYITITREYHYKESAFFEQKLLYSGKFYFKTKKAKKEKLADGDLWRNIIGYIRTEIIPEVVYYPNFIFNFPEKIRIPYNHEESSDEYVQILRNIINYTNHLESSKSGVVASMKKALTGATTLETLINAKKDSRSSQLKAILKRMSKVVTHEVLKEWSQLIGNGDEDIEVSFGEDLIEEERNIVNTESGDAITESVNDYLIEVSIEKGVSTYNIGQRSLGFKWFFAFILFTVFRKHQNQNRGILFLLDEPASNMHENGQKKLIKTLNQIIGEDSYVVYSTHSHHLINPNWLKGAYVVKNETSEENYLGADINIKCESYFQFAAKNANDRYYFQPILRALDYAPSYIEFSDKLVILEGRSDFYTFNLIKDLHQQNTIKFFPGNGATKLDFPIAHYLAWGKDFLIIMDADKEGNQQKKRYLELFGDILKTKIYTLHDIDKSFDGFTTEFLFEEKDRIAIQKNENPASNSYDKNLFNLAIMHMQLANSKINFSTTTKSNFNKVFKFISSNL